jgi:hypothetical protein
MAADTPMRFGASFIDSEGITASTVSHLYVDSAQTVAAVKTALAAWGDALNAITGATITSTRAAILGPGADPTGKPVANSEVVETAVFDFALATSGYHYGQVVPAILESLVGAGEQIDPSQTDVAAFITLMLGAVLGGHYTGANIDTLASFYRSFQADRKRRRQLFRKSVNYTQPS